MKPLFALMLAPLLWSPLHASSIIVQPTSDYFTTAWAFGAPYVRDADRDQLGISNVNPFGMGGSAWEETTYLTFDIASLGLTVPVQSAILTVTTVARSGFPAENIDGMTISAHALTSSPDLIDPSLGSSAVPVDGSFSYTSFKETELGAVVGSFVHGSAFGTYTIDLTDLVNEWLLNGDTNYAYATALTGRDEGNHPDAWLAIVNSGYEGSPFLTITPVPEPSSVALLGGLGVLAILRRKRG